MCDTLYDTKWYYLPVDLQKDVALLINRQQNGVKLSIGPFSTLNMECCYIVSFYNVIQLTNQITFCILKILYDEYSSDFRLQTRFIHSLCFY